MATTSATLSEPSCAGAQYNALQSVYAGSGYSAVADQILKAETPSTCSSTGAWCSFLRLIRPSSS